MTESLPFQIINIPTQETKLFQLSGHSGIPPGTNQMHTALFGANKLLESAAKCANIFSSPTNEISFESFSDIHSTTTMGKTVVIKILSIIYQARPIIINF